MAVVPQKELLLKMYKAMYLIRTFDNTAGELFFQGKIPGFIHTYVGEEAVAVGVCANLKPQDVITSTHRGHGHYIAKSMFSRKSWEEVVNDLKALAAELYGKKTGCNKGKGGSMHAALFEVGMTGANGIVGAGIPHGAGAALAIKYKKEGVVAVSFFGDGASNQGTFHEALNLSSIWKLPVVFVCENNQYAISVPSSYSVAVRDISMRGAAYAMPSVTVDGMDVLAVYEAAKVAIERARKGEGPSLIEAKTYRYRGHFEGDPMHYRTKEELEWWKAKDPIPRLRTYLLTLGIATEKELKEIEEEVKKTVEEAFKYAEESPWPDPKEAYTDVFYE